MTEIPPFWERLRVLLGEDGPRLVTGVPADDPELLDAAAATEGPFVVTRDQRVAAFAAAGWALTEERAAVLALQAGPSFENARVGLLEAASLGAPVIAVVTANALDAVGRGGFQELDVTTPHPELFRWEYHVRRPDDLDWAVRTALTVAEGARTGPVLLSIAPEVVRTCESDTVGTTRPIRPRTAVVPDEQGLQALVATLDEAARVTLVLGGGARRRHDRTAFIELAHALDASVLVTASGRGAYPERDSRFAGLCGLYATQRGRAELVDADVVLVLGSRLEETARMGWPASMGTLLRVDIDATVLETSAIAAEGFVGDAEATARALVARLAPRTTPPRALPARTKRIRPLPADAVTAPVLWGELGDVLADTRDGEETVLCQENGLADLWGYVADALALPDTARCVVPGEQTAMGFGLGAALGAAAAGRRVVAVCGDGAFEQNLSWLVSAGESRTDVLVIVLRNRSLGWPAQSRAVDDPLTTLRSHRDLVAFATSCSFDARAVDSVGDLRDALGSMTRARGPRLIEVEIRDLSVIPGPSEHAEEARA